MVDLSAIGRLIGARAPVAVLEIERDGWRITIRRGNAGIPDRGAVAVSSEAASVNAPLAAEPEPAPAAELVIVAPGYGMFHPAASPDDAPYVAIGHDVAVGQQVGVIEAMKMFSPIVSTVAGRITAIHVVPGDDVEAGSLLFSLT